MDEATSFEDAVTIATSSPMSASTSLTVVAGDDGGSAASVELFPDGHGLLEPTEGLLVRTNHFVSAEGAPGCTAARIGPGTRIRRDKLLAAFAGSLPDSTKEVVTAMDDHASIGGICVHADRSLPEEYWHATLATVSVDTEGCRLDVSADGPCAR
jgi:isopenicillin-N N-acyltransferase-like protein